jgi:hypothetical protein
VLAASLLARCVSWTSYRTARDFSLRTVNISRRVVNLMPSMREPAKDKLCILYSEDLPHGERFLPYGEKNLLLCGNLSRTRSGRGAKRRTLYFLNFDIKNENFKTFTGWLESSQINSRIVKIPFYFMRLPGIPLTY